MWITDYMVTRGSLEREGVIRSVARAFPTYAKTGFWAGGGEAYVVVTSGFGKGRCRTSWGGTNLLRTLCRYSMC